MFEVRADKPGHVVCSKLPSAPLIDMDLIASSTNTTISSSSSDFAAERQAIARLDDPPDNVEKMCDVHTKIVPFVPAQYRDDSLYKAPTPALIAAAADIKRVR